MLTADAPDLTDTAQVTLAISDCLARGMSDPSVITLRSRKGEPEEDFVNRRRQAITEAASVLAVSDYGFENLETARRLAERVLEQAIKGLEPTVRAAQKLADELELMAY